MVSKTAILIVNILIMLHTYFETKTLKTKEVMTSSLFSFGNLEAPQMRDGTQMLSNSVDVFSQDLAYHI